jgi:hypothetical protein
MKRKLCCEDCWVAKQRLAYRALAHNPSPRSNRPAEYRCKHRPGPRCARSEFQGIKQAAGAKRFVGFLLSPGIRTTRNGQSFGIYAQSARTDEVYYIVFRQKNQKDYVMRQLIPTLTQSGLLAVLLQRQRYKTRQLTWRRAQRKHMRAALWSTLTWPWRALTAPVPVRHSRRALRRIPHAPILNLLPGPIPPKCDSYDVCLTEMLDTLSRRGSNRPIVPSHRALEPAVTGS